MVTGANMPALPIKTLRVPNAIIGPFVLFAIWWIAFQLQLVTPRLLPSPTGTV